MGCAKRAAFEAKQDMAFVVTDACIDVKNKNCLEVCPVQCFFEGEDQLFINGEICIDCGACETVCPVQAIYSERDLPMEARHSIEKTAKFFQDNPEIEPALGSSRS